jgi:hypothetical protein
MPPDDTGRPPTSGEWRIAAELAPMTTVWRRLLRDHVPTSLGRCRACTQGGTGIPTARWPCGPRNVAEAARRHADGRAAPNRA